MFDKYIEERLGKKLIQFDFGFIILTKIDSENLYLEDIYVLPEHRSRGVAQKMSDYAFDVAKKTGFKFLHASCNIKAKNSEYSCKIIIENKFKFLSLDEKNDMIYFKKEII